MHAANESRLTARGARIAIVVSRYHREITDRLLDGAQGAFRKAGGDPGWLRVVEAAGAFELPLLVQAVLRRRDTSGAVALGCVISGETPHDQYICRAVSEGLMRVSLESAKPVGFGVLTCNSLAQAEARAGGAQGNKGEEAMRAALASCAALRSTRRLARRGGAR